MAELGSVPTLQDMDGIAHRTVFAHELLCLAVIDELARVDVGIVILYIDNAEFNFNHRIEPLFVFYFYPLGTLIVYHIIAQNAIGFLTFRHFAQTICAKCTKERSGQSAPSIIPKLSLSLA